MNTGKTRFKKGHLVSKEMRKKIGNAHRGKKLSEEHKRKLSESHKGYVMPSEQKRKISKIAKEKGFGKWMKGRGNSKLTKINRLRPSNKHYNWKGGITPENIKIRNGIEMRLWRESVFARDNWTCQKYGIRGGKLCPHHIQNFAQFPELRFAIDNGTTLSVKAHKEFHKKYGVKNNTKEQLEEFLKN